jgi:hypothetical protein
LEDLALDGKLIIKYISNKQDTNVFTGFVRIRLGSIGVTCERDNEPLIIKGEKFLD